MTMAPMIPSAAPVSAPGWYWHPTPGAKLLQDSALLAQAVVDPLRPLVVVRTSEGACALAEGGALLTEPGADALPVQAWVPALPPESLGDANFRRDYGLRYAYMTGAMANGIASVELVQAISRAGMLGIFGAAGLSLERIESAIHRLKDQLGNQPFGFNLIHSPNEPEHESATVALYLRHQIRLVEASAYLDLTLPVVRYRLAGIHRDATGQVVTPHRLIAKVSRVEVASKFLAPPPERLVRALVEAGELTPQQAQWAESIPMADDLTAEADSGGHTDNRPAITLLPTMLALRDRMQEKYRFARRVRVGAAGGIATPAAVVAAFSMGAGYVVTGSINQACVESGSSDLVREMLAQAEQADVIMAPAADMFEMGVKVQVLKRGTMFAMRAAKLYELYRAYPSLEALPPTERQALEKNVFRAPLADIWKQTVEFFQRRDPSQLKRAEADPKHRMALVFRWYLGLSSRWANAGEPSRQLDYQIWCGPAMGAFNEWAKGTYLETPRQRTVVGVAFNLLRGAAVLLRQNQLRWQGVTGREWFPRWQPEPMAEPNACP